MDEATCWSNAISSESYAGRYVPYISAAILNKKNIALFNLKGTFPVDQFFASLY